MSAPVIFILIGNTSHENDEIVAAYESKGAAEAEATRLNKLSEERPVCPLAGASEAKWVRYNQAENRWRKRFPRPDVATAEYFSVREIGFVAATAPAEDSPCTPPPGA